MVRINDVTGVMTYLPLHPVSADGLSPVSEGTRKSGILVSGILVLLTKFFGIEWSECGIMVQNS